MISVCASEKQEWSQPMLRGVGGCRSLGQHNKWWRANICRQHVDCLHLTWHLLDILPGNRRRTAFGPPKIVESSSPSSSSITMVTVKYIVKWLNQTKDKVSACPPLSIDHDWNSPCPFLRWAPCSGPGCSHQCGRRPLKGRWRWYSTTPH